MRKLFAAALLAGLVICQADAQQSNNTFYYTPGNSTAPGVVNMCFAGTAAVTCPGQPVTATFSGADTTSASATLAGASGKTTYICSFSVSGLGTSAAGGAGVVVTVGSLIGTVTANYSYFFVNGVANVNTPLNVKFSPCVPASAVGAGITITVPGAAGNTSTTITAVGYQLGGAFIAAAPFVGAGDVISGALVYYGLRAYSGAIAAAGTQKIVNVRNTGTNETCDILVAGNGGLSGSVTNCSGASSGANVSTFCTGGCAVPKIYDQSGNGNDASQATAANQPTFNRLLLNNLPGLVASNASSTNMASSLTTQVQAQPFMYSSVFLDTSVAAQTTLFSRGSGSSTAIGSQNGGAANTAWMYAGSAVGAAATDGSTHSIQSLINGASSEIDIDGTNTTGLNTSTNTIASNDQYSLFAFNLTSQFFNGNFFEVGLWPGSPALATRNSLTTNQRNYWGF